MDKFVVFYDTQYYHCTCISRCKVIDDNKYGMALISYIRGQGLTHNDNIFETLEKAREYAGHGNVMELV